MKISLRNLALVIVLAAPGAAAAQTPASPAASALITALDRVCLPLIVGQPIKQVASATGMKQTRGEWAIAIEGRQKVVVEPPTGVNPTVCTATVTYAPGGDDAILAALDNWAAARTPPLQKEKMREESSSAGGIRRLSSWLGTTPEGSHTIVLSEQKSASGGPAAGQLEQATLLINLIKP